MPNRTRQLAENAIMLGVSAVLLLLATYTVFGGIATFVIPLPFILLARQRTIRDMVVLLVAYGVLCLIIVGVANALPMVMFGISGLVMGYLYQKTKTALPAILAGAGVQILSLIIFMAISIYVVGLDVVGQLTKLDESIVNMQVPALPPGMTEAQYKESVKEMLHTFLTLLPVALMIFSVMTSGVNHWLARLITKRLGQPVPAMKPLREWSFPRSLLYYYFLTLLLTFFTGKPSTEGFFGSAIMNLKYLLDVLFTIQGLSFCAYLIYEKGWKKITPVLIVSLFIFPPVATILSLLGIFDLGIDLRKRVKRRM